ncbi:MAG: hypothetical protein AAB582_00700 [Patescibacteria group bacterium]
MNARLLWILIIVVIVIVGAWFAFGRTMEPTAEEMATTTPTGTVEQPSGTTLESTTITYSDTGFSPSSVRVAVGDTVTFTNTSSGDMWVGADEHPTHTNYDGTSTREHCADGTNTNGSFDQCVRSAPNTTWSYTFTKAGSFDYHNHARAAHGGTVVVE